MKIYVESGSNLGRISFANANKSLLVDLLYRRSRWMADRADESRDIIEVTHHKSQIAAWNWLRWSSKCSAALERECITGLRLYFVVILQARSSSSQCPPVLGVSQKWQPFRYVLDQFLACRPTIRVSYSQALHNCLVYTALNSSQMFPNLVWSLTTAIEKE